MQYLSPKIQVLKDFFQRGWTVWDLGSEPPTITVMLSQWIGREGLLVYFQTDKQSYLNVHDNATLNGCPNILFIRGQISSPSEDSPHRLALPVISTGLNFNWTSVLKETELTEPHLIRTGMTHEFAMALQHWQSHSMPFRPQFLVEGCSEAHLDLIKHFCDRNSYEVKVLTSQSAGPKDNTILLKAK